MRQEMKIIMPLRIKHGDRLRGGVQPVKCKVLSPLLATIVMAYYADRNPMTRILCGSA